MPLWPRKIRPAQPGDIPMVMDSWQRSCSRSPYAGNVPNSAWVETSRKMVTHLLARGARIVVAHSPDDTDHILGWACGEQDDRKTVLHYTYVKAQYRRDGIALELLGELLPPEPTAHMFYTHRPDDRSPGADLVRALHRTAGYRLVWAPEISRREDL